MHKPSMASRQSSTASNGQQRKPSTKAKPFSLKGSPVPSSIEDYLNDNLLEQDDPPPISNLPQRPRRDTSHRLVIGIDYGTTFTGKKASYRALMRTDSSKRCRIRNIRQCRR